MITTIAHLDGHVIQANYDDGNDGVIDSYAYSEYNDADKLTEYSVDDDGDGTIDHRTVMGYDIYNRLVSRRD